MKKIFSSLFINLLDNLIIDILKNKVFAFKLQNYFNFFTIQIHCKP